MSRENRGRLAWMVFAVAVLCGVFGIWTSHLSLAEKLWSTTGVAVVVAAVVAVSTLD